MFLLSGAFDGRYAAAAAAAPSGGGRRRRICFRGLFGGVGGAGEHLHHLFEGGGVSLDKSSGIRICFMRSGDCGLWGWPGWGWGEGWGGDQVE